MDYSSTNREVFQDLQLNIKGVKGIYESLGELVAEEVLDAKGGNQYRAGEHGLQVLAHLSH